MHAFESSQVTAVPPTHAPLEQASPVVQALLSLHVVPFVAGGFEQLPVAGSHEPATWHWSLAAHVFKLLPVHTPATQVSVCVQGLPSLHGVPETLPFAGQGALLPVHVAATSH